MILFNTTNYTIDTKCDKNIIHISESNDINKVFNILNNCYTNKKQCIITDTNLDTELPNKPPKNIDKIHILFKAKHYTISWITLEYINLFFKDKYVLNNNFNTSPSIFNIFFLLIIDKYKSSICSNTKLLIGNNNAIFGIYHSYNDVIYNCSYSLYFSFNIFSFILYNVHCSNNYVAGKLLPNIDINNNNLIINKQSYKCPKSFIALSDKKYAIKKRDIIFKTQAICKLVNPPRYSTFYNGCYNYNIYFIKLNNLIDEYILNHLFKFLTSKYPVLNDKSNICKYNPLNFFSENSNFSIYFLPNTTTLIIQLNAHLALYINNIIHAIAFFMKKLSCDRSFNINQFIINQKDDNYIHIVSELYYLIICVIYFLPQVYYNLTDLCTTDYIQVNYKFDIDEINNLFLNKNPIFTDKSIYLKSIFIKALGMCMSNKYCFILDDTGLNVIPIFKNMTNSNIITLLERSQKAHLTKEFITSYITTIIQNSKNKYEYPVVLLHINTIKIFDNIDIQKIYTVNSNKTIPISINILYNDTTLHISISYKKKYIKFKYIFEEIINELIL